MKNFKEINRTFTVKKTKFLQRVLWLMIPLLTMFSVNVWGEVKTFNSFSGLGSSTYSSGSTTSAPLTLSSTGWYGYSASQLRIKSGSSVTLSCTSDYKITQIVFTVTGTSYATLSNVTWSSTTGTYNSSGTTSASFTASGQCRLSSIVVTYSSASGSSSTYTLVTDASTLKAGDIIVFGNAANGAVAGEYTPSYLTKQDATISAGVLTASAALEFTLGGSAGAWTFNNGTSSLRATSATALSLATSGGLNTWTISINASNNATVAPSVTYTTGLLQYNSGSPRFKNYTSTQAVIQIYRKGTSCSKKVALSGGSPSHGTVTFSPTGPVETCDAAQNVAMTITPTTGYKLTGWSTSGVSPSSTSPAVSTSGSTSETAQNITLTFAKEANGTYNASATFSQIMVSSLKLRAQQTGQTDKTGSDLTMTCYPKEGQTGGADPLNHTLNVAFYEVLPSNALTKTYTWSVRVKANGAANWTDVSFTGNTLNTNDIVNSFNKSTGALQIKSTEGTAEIKITADDGSGVTAKVTITVSNVALTGVSVLPTEMEVYAGQKKPVTVTFTPANATDRSYTTGSYTYVNIQNKAAASFNIEGKTTVTDANHNETVTVTTTDGSHTATINVTVKPLPKATFLDIVHSLTDFSTGGAALPSTGILIATVSADGQTVTTTKKTPTHSDLSDPGSGNECERNHLHLAGWILKDWADEHPDATSSDISGAGAGNFYAPDADIDLVAKNGKTFYAVWAIIE